MRDQYSVKRGITLIELLISLVLMTMIVLSFASFDLYGRYHVLTADRRARVQNDVAFVLEHMTKEISKAEGDVNHQPILIPSPPPGGRMEQIQFNSKDCGCVMSYDFYGTPAGYPFGYLVEFCEWGVPAAGKTISKKITNVSPNYNVTNNYLDIELTGCYDPDGTPNTCGTPDNPSVTMRTRIKMPSVSTH